MRKEVEKQQNTDEQVKTFYTKVFNRMQLIKTEIQRNEERFESLLIRNHPVGNAVLLAMLETRTQPANNFAMQKHSQEIQARLNNYKALVGTAFCKKPSQAYDLLAEHIVKNIITTLKKELPTMPELTMQYSQLYEELIIAHNRTK